MVPVGGAALVAGCRRWPAASRPARPELQSPHHGAGNPRLLADKIHSVSHECN